MLICWNTLLGCYFVSRGDEQSSYCFSFFLWGKVKSFSSRSVFRKHFIYLCCMNRTDELQMSPRSLSPRSEISNIVDIKRGRAWWVGSFSHKLPYNQNSLWNRWRRPLLVAGSRNLLHFPETLYFMQSVVSAQVFSYFYFYYYFLKRRKHHSARVKLTRCKGLWGFSTPWMSHSGFFSFQHNLLQISESAGFQTLINVWSLKG